MNKGPRLSIICIKVIKKHLFINRLQQVTVKTESHIIQHRIKIVAAVLIMRDRLQAVINLDRQIAVVIAVVGVVLGAHVAVPGPTGLLFQRRKAITRAWKV